MGGDRDFQAGKELAGSFQSTPPVWGATGPQGPHQLHLQISIHAPRVGGDVILLREHDAPVPISIHAPRVGGDKNGMQVEIKKLNYFNPRPPCGGRQPELYDMALRV